MEQSEKDTVYNVDGIDIIVQEEVEKEIQGAKINYGGLLFKDFIVTPKY
ncbi:MAG: hypothetical protein AB7V48_08680 [Sedimentibacter sp.]